MGDEKKENEQEDTTVEKLRDLGYASEDENLGPLRLQSSVPGVIRPFRYPVQCPIGMTNLRSKENVKIIREWLKGAIEWLDAKIAELKAGIPQVKPEKWEHRAKAEIDFFILCYENNRFYVNQYYHLLDALVNDKDATEVITSTAAKERRPYLVPFMPYCLKQRCEEFQSAVGKRPPIFGAEDGKAACDRFVNAFGDFQMKHGTTTWTNFFGLGWQRQYWWTVKIPPKPGGGGGGGGHSVKKPIPRPPSYQRPGGPAGPAY